MMTHIPSPPCPCTKDCKERKVGCKSTCSKGIAYAKAKEQEYAAKAAERDRINGEYEYHARIRRRIERRLG